MKHHINSERVRCRFDDRIRDFSEFGRESMGELRLCPCVCIYSDIRQHFAVVGRREVLQCDDGVFGDDGKGNDALCILPNAKVLDFAVAGEEVGAGEEAAEGEGVGAVDA